MIIYLQINISVSYTMFCYISPCCLPVVYDNADTPEARVTLIDKQNTYYNTEGQVTGDKAVYYNAVE